MKGEFGPPQDAELAKFWLLKIVNNECSVKHLKTETRNKIPEMLAQLGVVEEEAIVANDDVEGED